MMLRATTAVIQVSGYDLAVEHFVHFPLGLIFTNPDFIGRHTLYSVTLDSCGFISVSLSLTPILHPLMFGLFQ